MNDEPGKVFDVSKPSRRTPSSTSRPIIVGHRPSVPDPMMRPASAPMPPPAHTALPETTPPQPAIAPASHGINERPLDTDQSIALAEHHEPKIVSVSDNVRNEIEASQPHLPELPKEGESQPASPPAQPGIVSTSNAAIDTPASSFASSATIPGGNVVTPSTVTVATSPPAVVPEVHHQSLPMGHAHATSAGRLKHFLLWLFIALLLIGFLAFLAIDSGFVSSSVKLPFHIFDRQT